MAINIAIAEGKALAKAKAESKIVVKAIAEDKIIAKVLGQFNGKNLEQLYLLSG